MSVELAAVKEKLKRARDSIRDEAALQEQDRRDLLAYYEWQIGKINVLLKPKARQCILLKD